MRNYLLGYIPYLPGFKQLILLLLLLPFAMTNLAAETVTISGYKADASSLLARFKKHVKVTTVNTQLKPLGLSLKNHFNKVGVSSIQFLNKDLDIKKAISLLENSGLVEYAEPNYIQYARVTPNDPRFPEMWGLNNTGQTGGVPDADIDAPEAWDLRTDASNVVIEVIDTGTDYTHPDLSANMWRNPGEIPNNGIDDEGNGLIDDVYGVDARDNDTNPMDDNDHGTHTAGTIGAVGNNAIGVTGVAWNAQIMALRFLGGIFGSGTTEDAIRCLDYALMMKQDFAIPLAATSNSWGGGGFSQALKDAIAAHGANNILFVASAGNDARNTDSTPSYPASYDEPNIISVASTTHTEDLSSFSNFGTTTVDLGAPGSDILSTTRNNTYSVFSGTSMAAPHVGGVVALLAAANPTWAASDIKDRILSTVDPVASLAGITGSGGRLNAVNALTPCDGLPPEFHTSLQDNFEVEVNHPQILSAWEIADCFKTRGISITASFSNGDPDIILLDDGNGPDVVADDGVFSGSWDPLNTGTVDVTFTAVSSVVTTLTRSGNVLPSQDYDSFVNLVPFDWVDISGFGRAGNLTDDDYVVANIPFPVRFYGQAYNSITVSSNGAITFEPVGVPYSNSALPTGQNSPSTLIAAFWDDLNPSAGGDAYGAVIGNPPERKLVIQWADIPHYGGTADGASFQVIFFENNFNIQMQYLDVDLGNLSWNQGNSATVGLQRNGSYAQQFSFNQPVLTDGMTILWAPVNP